MEIRANLSTFGITNGQTISMSVYFDNADSDNDDHTPDSGSYGITFGCGAPGGDCSPTAVTLNSLEAKTDTQNNTAVLILAGAVLTLGVAVVAIRRRRIA